MPFSLLFLAQFHRAVIDKVQSLAQLLHHKVMHRCWEEPTSSLMPLLPPPRLSLSLSLSLSFYLPTEGCSCFFSEAEYSVIRRFGSRANFGVRFLCLLSWSSYSLHSDFFLVWWCNWLETSSRHSTLTFSSSFPC